MLTASVVDHNIFNAFMCMPEYNNNNILDCSLLLLLFVENWSSSNEPTVHFNCLCALFVRSVSQQTAKQFAYKQTIRTYEESSIRWSEALERKWKWKIRDVTPTAELQAHNMLCVLCVYRVRFNFISRPKHRHWMNILCALVMAFKWNLASPQNVR